MIGVTILLLIITYDVDPHRTKGQGVGFAAVLFLAAQPAMGFVLECLFATDRKKRFSVLWRELPHANNNSSTKGSKRSRHAQT
ncbi:hypothetical protein [Variovorax gracilis]|uniref:hypothetical protein n=1 Tax=Variovorax gracilis TaxID=3053502 RepID=UPI00257754C6|nr:hypothetical protein [Variovorax sp. J22R24]